MNNKITYHREETYFISDFCLPKQPNGHIGVYNVWKITVKLFKKF